MPSRRLLQTLMLAFGFLCLNALSREQHGWFPHVRLQQVTWGPPLPPAEKLKDLILNTSSLPFLFCYQQSLCHMEYIWLTLSAFLFYQAVSSVGRCFCFFLTLFSAPRLVPGTQIQNNYFYVNWMIILSLRLFISLSAPWLCPLHSWLFLPSSAS